MHKIKDFEKYTGRKYTWDEIDMDFYYRFVNWMTDHEGHKKNTVGRYIKNFKTVMQDAFDADIHTNQNHKKSTFKAVQEQVDTIYLNENEVKALLEYKVPIKSYDIAKDIWLTCVLSMQRISDYEQVIEIDNHLNTVKGNRIIKFRQKNM